MQTRTLVSVVLVTGWFGILIGCGGIAQNSCPNGVCETVCTGDTFASGSSCLPITECEPGTYVAQAGTGISDQICEGCPSGSYSNVANSPACTPWRTCLPGSYSSNVPSASTDRTCATCSSGTYTTGVNQSACLASAACPAGTVETSPGNATTPHVCTPCNAGEYCAGGATPAVACTGEKWDDDNSPATDCVPKTTCPAGNVVLRSGSATSDRTCAPCTSGTFSATENAASCSSWAICLPGTYVSNSPSATQDRKCLACADGSYTSQENQSICLLSGDCPAGTAESSPGTATSKPDCAPCTEGEFCPGGSAPAKACADQTWDNDGDPATACVPWSVCPAGTYIAIPGSAVWDRVCGSCIDGTFSSAANSSSCADWTDCQAGTYAAVLPSDQHDRSCFQCDDRTFSTQLNQTSCTAWTTCPDNTTFVGVPGTTSTDVECSACALKGCASYCTQTGVCFDCLTYTDCGAGLACDRGTCTDLGCGGASYFEESFASANANWWTMDGAWDIGAATAWTGGTVETGTSEDPTSDHSPGTDDMLAGVAIGGVAPADVTSTPNYLTSAAIDTSQGPSPVYLEFYRWLNSDVAAKMTNTVEVFDGRAWVILWSGPEDGTGVLGEDGWTWQVYNVTDYRNPNFRVRFGYLVKDASVGAVGSWNIDDVRIANNLTCVD
jgi:hypothetical protein